MPKVVSGPKDRRPLTGGFSPRNRKKGERAAKSAPETSRIGIRAALKIVSGYRFQGDLELGGHPETQEKISRFPAPTSRRIPVRLRSGG